MGIEGLVAAVVNDHHIAIALVTPTGKLDLAVVYREHRRAFWVGDVPPVVTEPIALGDLPKCGRVE